MTMHGDAPASPLTGLPGWVHDLKEEYNLVSLGEGLPDRATVVCLGGYWGRDVGAIAYGVKRQRRQNVQIYAVQQFPQGGHPPMVEGLRLNMESAGYDDIVTVIDENPLLVARRWSRPVDLLYIRYSNNTQELCNLIQAWLSFLNHEKIVVFGNYYKGVHSHEDHLAIKKAVDSWHERSQWKKVDGNGSLVWFIAPRQTEEPKVPNFPEVGRIVMSEELEDKRQPEDMTLEELIAIGEKAGLKMGRYGKKETVLKVLKQEGILG